MGDYPMCAGETNKSDHCSQAPERVIYLSSAFQVASVTNLSVSRFSTLLCWLGYKTAPSLESVAATEP